MLKIEQDNWFHGFISGLCWGYAIAVVVERWLL